MRVVSKTIVSNSLFISSFEKGENSPYFFLYLNQSSILKFYNQDENLYYSPEILEFSLKQRVNNVESFVPYPRIELTISYKNSSIKNETIIYMHDNKTGNFSYNFIRKDEAKVADIEKLSFACYSRKGELDKTGTLVAHEEIYIFYGTNEDLAKFSVKANGIYASVRDAGFEFNEEGLTISGGSLIIKEPSFGETVFEADEKGNLFFKGEINSQKGLLSGWVIDETEIRDSRKEENGSIIEGTVGLSSADESNESCRYYPDSSSPIRFWAGANISSSNEMNYTFAVSQDGTLYANNANVVGDVIAESGRILNTFYVGPNNSTGIIIHGDKDSSYIGSMRYASGALGGGWTISSDGSAEFNNVSVRGKITSSVFEYGHISSIGGSLYVAPTYYTENNSGSIAKKDGAYTVSWTIKGSIDEAFGSGRSIAEGDFLLIDGNVFLNSQMFHLSNVLATIGEIPQIENDGSQVLTISFSSNEESLENGYFQPGTTIVYYGSSSARSGLYLTAMGQNAPYLEIYNNSPIETAPIPAVRLGNLSGIVDSDFPEINLSGYGLYSSNAYLRGQLMLPNAGVTNQTGKTKGNSDIRFWAGLDEDKTNIEDANFIVTQDGSLYAKKGVFEGVVKANDSEFSGTIKAAGILLNTRGKEKETDYDHFYVAYDDSTEEKEFSPSFNNYIINIDKTGLSIWEGGLQAYSDAANLLNGGEKRNALRAYWSKEQIEDTLPFLYLVDIGTEKELNSRLVSNKISVINFTPTTGTDGASKTSKYITVASQIDKGFWLRKINTEISNNTNCRDIEANSFGFHDAGLTLEDNLLILKNYLPNGVISLSGERGVFINEKEADRANIFEGLFVRGEIQVKNEIKETSMALGSAIIQEARDDNGNTIGFNFVTTS